MQFHGEYTLPAPSERVWETLLDPDVLASCLPGCQEFRIVGPDEYEATLAIGMSVVRGTYRGTVKVSDKQPISSFRLEVGGGGGATRLTAGGRIELSPLDGKTLVRYTGDYRVAGGVLGFGERLFLPVAQMLANEYFRCIERHLSER